MKADDYIREVLSKYTKENKPRTLLLQEIEKFIGKIRGWAGEVLHSISFSGSYFKGTYLSGIDDIDLLISLDLRTQGTLNEIYNNLFNYLQSENYSPFKNEFSIGVVDSGFSFDLMPSFKNFNSATGDILISCKNNKCIQTNIDAHNKLILNSGKLNEIIAIKIWRNLNRLKFPTLYLELCVLDALHRSSKNQLAKNFIAIIEYFLEFFMDTKITDPVNSQNIISDLLIQEEKTLIVQAAQETRNRANWADIIW